MTHDTQRRAEILSSLTGSNVEREGALIQRVLELEGALKRSRSSKKPPRSLATPMKF